MKFFVSFAFLYVAIACVNAAPTNNDGFYSSYGYPYSKDTFGTSFNIESHLNGPHAIVAQVLQDYQRMLEKNTNLSRRGINFHVGQLFDNVVKEIDNDNNKNGQNTVNNELNRTTQSAVPGGSNSLANSGTSATGDNKTGDGKN